MLYALLGLIVIAAIAVGVVLAVRSDSSKKHATSTTTTASGTPTVGDAATAANSLFAAWQENNRSAAASAATPAAVKQIFKFDAKKNADLTFSSCTPNGSAQECTWQRPGGVLTLVVRQVANTDLVVKATLTADGLPPTTVTTAPKDSTTTSRAATTTSAAAGKVTTPTITQPTDPQGFAQALFNAWKSNSQTAAANVASPTAVQQMFAVPYSSVAPNGTSSYSFSGCQGAGAAANCTFRGSGVPTITMQVRIATGGIPVTVDAVTRAG
jgi:hypothetical protein